MAATPPGTTQRKLGGVFLRIRPGTQEAVIVRPMNAKAGQKFIKVDRGNPDRNAGHHPHLALADRLAPGPAANSARRTTTRHHSR